MAVTARATDQFSTRDDSRSVSQVGNLSSR